MGMEPVSEYYLIMVLQVPTGETLTFADESFNKFEDTGVQEACKAAFVLVAGGLGERLGYSGIKVYRVSVYLALFCCSIMMCVGYILCIYRGPWKPDVHNFTLLSWDKAVTMLSTLKINQFPF